MEGSNLFLMCRGNISRRHKTSDSPPPIAPEDGDLEFALALIFARSLS